MKRGKWAIRQTFGGRTYYRKRTAIGPCFGGAEAEAMTFATKRDALAEMAWHAIGFVMTEAVKIDVRKGK